MAATEAGKDTSTYSMKWTNHKNIIIQTFAEQLHKEWLVDVTVSCEGQFIKAHKMMLSACSPFFEEIFSTHTRVDHPVIIMNGVKYAIFQQLIDFMYEGEIRCAHEDFELLLATAESLQIKGLCKIRPEDVTTINSPCKLEDDKKDIDTKDSVANIDVDTTHAHSKSRKRRKQSHSPILNQSVDGTPADETLFSGLFGNDDDNDSQKSDAKISKQEVQINKSDSFKQAPKIPRPPNAFMIFANEWRKKLALQYSGESNKEISVRLGNMWKSLSSTTRDQYYAAAKKADEEHKIKYPGYYYSPKEARLRKEMRGNNASKSSSGVLVNSSGVVKDIEPSSVVTLVPMPETIDDDSNEMIPSDEIKEEPGISSDDASDNSDSSVTKDGTNVGAHGKKNDSTNKQLPSSAEGIK